MLFRRKRQLPIRSVLWAVAMCVGLARGGFASVPTPTTCSYMTWVWNTRTKRSEGHARVIKPYSDLTPEEKDPFSDCTICEEDQVTIHLDGIPSFQVCRQYAEDVRRVVQQVKDAGFPIKTIISYRVGRSKGNVDRNGLRTEFSHHSFGTALDINSEQNGLYTNCSEFGPDCRILRGGPWRPNQPGTVTKDSVVYRGFHEIGWKWGGELSGQQKDFMHFSLSGD